MHHAGRSCRAELGCSDLCQELTGDLLPFSCLYQEGQPGLLLCLGTGGVK